MKLFWVLALCVSVALGLGSGSSTHYYGWQPGQELTYRFETEILSGIPEIRQDQYSGLKLASTVIIQTRSDYSLLCKFSEPKVILVNGHLEMRNGQPVVPYPEEEVPEQLKKHLVEPFLVHLKAGLVESFFVGQNEPVVVTNIKKALLSQLQLDLTASRNSDIVRTNLIPSESGESMIEPGKAFFTTEESSLNGDCQKDYNMYPLPKHQALDLEAQWEEESQELCRMNALRGPVSEGKKACEGQQYWTITKTDDFDNCRQRPMYVQRQGMKMSCDVGKAECKGSFSTSGSTKYVVCGTPERFTIREIVSQNTGVVNILGINTEKTISASRVKLFLVKVVRSGRFQPLTSTSDNSKQVRTLIMEYPEGDIWSSHSSISPMKVNQGPSSPVTNVFEPVRPLPDLHSPDNIYPSVKTTSQIYESVIKMVSDIVGKIGHTGQPDNISSEMTGKLSAIVADLRFLTYSELQALETEFKASFAGKGRLQAALADQLFIDILAQTGTNPAVLFVKEKFKNGLISGNNERVTQLIQTVIRNVRTPTKEILRELIQMVDGFKGLLYFPFYHSGLSQLSTLLYRACVDPSTSVSNFPVRIYGRFCTKDSSVLVEEYIPYLIHQLEHPTNNGHRLAFLTALGKTGHRNALLPIASAIEGNPDHVMTRSLAVRSLRRIGKQEPALVKPILLALINNIAENSEVRIAAISVLPYAQPSTAELQKIAVRSWFEPSVQVTSFLYSTFKSMVQTEIPELKAVGERCKTLLSLVKPARYGIQFSHNSHFETFSAALGLGNKLKFSIVQSPGVFVPPYGAVSIDLYGAGLWEVKHLDWTLYNYGMEVLVDRLVAKIYNREKSPSVARELNMIKEQLHIKPRGLPRILIAELLSQFRMFDLETIFYASVIGVTHDLASSLKSRAGLSPLNIQAVLLTQGEMLMPTSSGFPIFFESSSALAYDMHWHFGPVPGPEEGINFKSTPVSLQVVSSAAVLCPFSKQHLGTGSEIAFHAHMPLYANLKLYSIDKITLALKHPKEIAHAENFEIIHTKVRGFTFIKDCHRPGPVTESTNLKELVSGNPLTKATYKFGQAMGFEGGLKLCTDYPVYDFAYNYNMLKENGLGGLTGLIPRTLKKLDVRLAYKPAASKTKEIELTFNLISAITSHNGTLTKPSAILDILSGNPIGSSSESTTDRPTEQEIRDICLENYPSSPAAQHACIEEHALAAPYPSLVESQEEIEKVCQIALPLSPAEKRLCIEAYRTCRKALKICKLPGIHGRFASMCSEDTSSCFRLKSTVLKTFGVWKMQKEIEQVHGQTMSKVAAKGLHLDIVLKKSSEPSQHASLSVVRGSTDYSGTSYAILTFWDISFEAGNGSPNYEVRLYADTLTPQVLERWNVDALLAEPLQMKWDVELIYGVKGGLKNRIGLRSLFKKDNDQIEAVRTSPEYKKCKRETQLGRALSSVCMETRNQAASVHTVQATVYYPKSLFRKSHTLIKLYNGLKSLVMSNVELPIVDSLMEEESAFVGGNENERTLEATFDRVGSAFNMTLKPCSQGLPTYHLKNVRVPLAVTGVMPFSLLNGVSTHLIQAITSDQAPASCTFEGDTVTTFDNRTYTYELSNCEQLLFKDCSDGRPTAVTATKDGTFRNLNILLGLHKVVMKEATPTADVQDVYVDGQKVQIPRNQLYMRNSPETGSVSLKIYRSHGGVVKVENPEERVIVFFDNRRIEIVAPQTLRDKGCGLCGDLNLENTADLISPETCVFSKDRFFGYSYIISNHSSCIPQQDMAAYSQEKKECTMVHTLATPVTPLVSNLLQHEPKPTTGKHLIHKETSRVCFSKTLEKVCGKAPSQSDEVVVSFACFTWPSSKGHQLLKRAEAGEVLLEVMNKPVAFSQKRNIVVRCSEKPM